jgi:hypothetical protein
MVQGWVACTSCGEAYDIDASRVPEKGMRMRCPPEVRKVSTADEAKAEELRAKLTAQREARVAKAQSKA